jgi:selenide, water dikinase
MQTANAADLVLVGGGHAHVQILRRFMLSPLRDVRLSVVLDRPVAVYSGMLPGCVSGDYAAFDLEIDVVPLARRAGARVLLARATGIDPERKRIALEGRPPIAYDVASLDVGSSVRGLTLPGVCENALATRPIGSFLAALEQRLTAARAAAGQAALRVAVVGGGAAGVELALALRARLLREACSAEITLMADTARVLADQPERVANSVTRALALRGIALRCGSRVARVEPARVHFEAGDSAAADLVLWATGAAPHAWLAASPLPLDAQGFVRIRDTLQVVGHPDLFAVGDCADGADRPWVRKAGVYAVRQGPVLDANLRARVAGASLRAYRPQRDFLTLLNLGERQALGFKWGVALSGRGVWRAKDWIDRRFVQRFQVLAADGAPAPAFPAPAAPGENEMPCGGCAAKLGATALARALAQLPPAPPDATLRIGLGEADDAAAVTLPGGALLLASLDAFPAFCEDEWLVGRSAAVNAVSDVYAMGGEPRHALALVTLPRAAPHRAEQTLLQVLAGVRAAFDPLGVSLVGGHTTLGEALFVGLCVTGHLAAGAPLLRLRGAQPGQHLVLSKPLGTGVLLAAQMRGLARGRWLAAAFDSMLRPNGEAQRVARALGATACTDVSGFGLLGHLASMLRASGTGARLRLGALPALEGAAALLARGVRSSFHAQNACRPELVCGDASLARSTAAELLFDPQTSGGLLFALPAEHSDEAVARLRARGDAGAAVVGEITPARRDAALVELY